MTVLVVGGAGYIGSHVCKALLERGKKVVVADNLSTGRHENILPGVKFRHVETSSLWSLQRVLKEFSIDAIVHLAAKKAAGESMVDPEKYSQENLIGTLNLLHAALEKGIKKIVFSSSAAVYGPPQYLPIDENHPVNPLNYYGFTKLEIEKILSWYAQLKGIRYAALRYFNAAGYDPESKITGLENKPANLLPVVMEAAVGIRKDVPVFGDDYDTEDGTGVRDYIHVTDLAEAHCLALEKLDNGSDNITVNLGSETGLSVLEMIESARRISGRDFKHRILERRPGDPARLVASSQKAFDLLGWKAKYSTLESLVETTWKVYRKAYLR